MAESTKYESMKILMLGDKGVDKNIFITKLTGIEYPSSNDQKFEGLIDLDNVKQLKYTITFYKSTLHFSKFIGSFNGAILIFDLQKKDTLELVTKVLEDLPSNIENPEYLYVTILGDKCNDQGKIEVNEDDMRLIEEKYKVKYYDISNENNAQKLMKDFLQQVYNTKIKMVSEKNQKKEERNQKVAPKEKKGSCGCC